MSEHVCSLIRRIGGLRRLVVCKDFGGVIHSVNYRQLKQGGFGDKT
jgi:hypothetical protein